MADAYWIALGALKAHDKVSAFQQQISGEYDIVHKTKFDVELVLFNLYEPINLGLSKY